MAEKYKPAIRDGVKGHIIEVAKHEKFVPAKYDDRTKKRR